MAETNTLPSKVSTDIASTDTLILNVGGKASRATVSEFDAKLAGTITLNVGVGKKYTTFQAAKTAADTLLSSLSLRGDEKITNGNFTGSATGWTVPTGWAYNSDNVIKNADGILPLQQDCGLIPGRDYELILTVSSRTAGRLICEIGDVKGTEINVNGTYTQSFRAISNSPLKIVPANNSRLIVDSVSVKEILVPVTIVVGKNADGSAMQVVNGSGVPYDVMALYDAGIKVVYEQEPSTISEYDRGVLTGTIKSHENLWRGISQNQDIRFQHAAIAVEFSDMYTADYTLHSIFTSRGIPVTLAAQPHRLDMAGYMTTAQLKTCQDNGCEIAMHFHGRDDVVANDGLLYPVNPTGLADIYKRMVHWKREFTRQGLNCQSHVDGGGTTGKWRLDSAEKFNSDFGRLVEGNYLSSMGIAIPGFLGQIMHPAPLPTRLGVGFYTIESFSVATVEAAIDSIIKYGACSILALHPYLIDTVGYLTTAQLTTIADYIVAKRDAGLLNVLTATGLAFTRKGDDINQFDDPSFDLCAAPGTLSSFWTKGGSGAAIVVSDTGGVNNGKYVTIPHNSYLLQYRLRPHARAFRIDFYAQCSSTKNLSVIIGKCIASAATRTITVSIDSTTWKKFSVIFGRNYQTPEASDNNVDPGPQVLLQNTSGTNIDVDETKLVEL